MHKNISQHDTKGFTLVELAISLMIIGLLIAGVLKGQELILNAKATSTMQQVQNYRSAVAAFRTIYKYWPGDIVNAQARIPNCTTAPCNTVSGGLGNRMIDQPVAPNQPWSHMVHYGQTAEGTNFFLHMQKAGLWSGVEPNGTYAPSGQFTYGWEYPVGPFENSGYIARGVLAESYPVGVVAPYPPMRGNYIFISGYSYNMPVPAPMAAMIDRKMDDGKPYTGSVMMSYGLNGGISVSCTTAATATADYNESNGRARCEMLFSLEE